MSHAAIIPPHSVRYYPPGQACLDAVAGDLVLVRSAGFVAAGIRFFERLRASKHYAWCNHAAIVLNSGPNAHVAQEAAKGVEVTPIAELGALEYAVVHFDDIDLLQRQAVTNFAAWSIGLGYGFLSIPADAINALLGLELGVVVGNRMVCSTQATRALERAGYIPKRSPYAMTPAHLAQDFGAVMPSMILKVSHS